MYSEWAAVPEDLLVYPEVVVAADIPIQQKTLL